MTNETSNFPVTQTSSE
ncbi:hypothetical protein AYI70_g8016, partial [Smittium culicis]